MNYESFRLADHLEYLVSSFKAVLIDIMPGSVSLLIEVEVLESLVLERLR